jgi:hypothetical protein
VVSQLSLEAPRFLRILKQLNNSQETVEHFALKCGRTVQILALLGIKHSLQTCDDIGRRFFPLCCILRISLDTKLRDWPEHGCSGGRGGGGGGNEWWYLRLESTVPATSDWHSGDPLDDATGFRFAL